MYIPQHFTDTDSQVLRRIIETYPLGTLVIANQQALLANHLPFLLDESTSGYELLAHVSDNNEIAQLGLHGSDVLVTFLSQNSYISPNWYPSKGETHQAVPTWNYQAVHMYGELELSKDKKTLLNILGRLTKFHEHQVGEAQPWRMSDAPAEFMDTMLRSITAVRIRVNKVLFKSKLSQNRSGDDHASVKQAMDRLGHTFMSNEMSRHRSEQK